jgi:hypothetical protein
MVELPVVKNLHGSKQYGGQGKFNWSPDGRQVAYFAGQDMDAGLYVVEVHTGQAERISVFDYADWSHIGEMPYWSPDGQYLIYANDGAVHPLAIVHTDGSGDWQLPVPEGFDEPRKAELILWSTDLQTLLIGTNPSMEPPLVWRYELTPDLHTIMQGSFIHIGKLVDWAETDQSIIVDPSFEDPFISPLDLPALAPDMLETEKWVLPGDAVQMTYETAKWAGMHVEPYYLTELRHREIPFCKLSLNDGVLELRGETQAYSYKVLGNIGYEIETIKFEEQLKGITYHYDAGLTVLSDQVPSYFAVDMRFVDITAVNNC